MAVIFKFSSRFSGSSDSHSFVLSPFLRSFSICRSLRANFRIHNQIKITRLQQVLASTLSACGSIGLLHPLCKIFDQKGSYTLYISWVRLLPISCFRELKMNGCVWVEAKIRNDRILMHTKTLFRVWKKHKLFSLHSADRFDWMWHFVCIFPYQLFMEYNFFFCVSRCDAAISWGSFVTCVLRYSDPSVSLFWEFEGPFSKAAVINPEFKIKTHRRQPTESQINKASALGITAGTGLLFENESMNLSYCVVCACVFCDPDFGFLKICNLSITVCVFASNIWILIYIYAFMLSWNS